jgi:hypothetical protein
MPYKHEIDHKLLPANLDRRRKLSDKNRAEIRLSSASTRALARAWGVSRRLIDFIRNPEKHLANLAARKALGGSKRYYDRERHTQHVRETRRHRQNHKNELLTSVKAY